MKGRSHSLLLYIHCVAKSCTCYPLLFLSLITPPPLFPFPIHSSPLFPLPLPLPPHFFTPSCSLLPPPLLTHTHRYHCGVPVIIEGETGVGKTALLEMLSKLWNQSLLLEWKRQRGRLLDFIREKLGAIAADVSENYQVYFNSFCSLFFPLLPLCLPFFSSSPLPLSILPLLLLSSNLRCVWKQWRH